MAVRRIRFVLPAVILCFYYSCAPNTDHWLLASAEFSQRDFLGAIIELNLYLMEDQPINQKEALVLRAQCYNRLEKHTKAEADLKAILAIDSTNEAALLEFARLKIFLGDTANALMMLSRLYSGSGHLVSEAWIEAGKIHFGFKEYEKSLEEFNNAIHADSSNEYAWYFKGALRSSFVGEPDSANPYLYPYLDFNEADHAFSKATMLNPTFADAWFKWALLDLNRFDDSGGLSKLARAIKFDSLNPGYFVARADYLAKRGHKKQAYIDYSAALRIGSPELEVYEKRRQLFLR